MTTTEFDSTAREVTGLLADLAIRRKTVLVAAIAALGGCSAMDPALHDRIASEAATLAPSVEDDAAVLEVGTRVAEGGVPAPDAWPVPADAGLDHYVSLALERNPAIHRAIREVEALGYRVPQVTSLEDPMITGLPPTGDMIETAAGMINGAVGVAQKIPFPGKLATRGRIAEQAVRVALDRLADVRIRTVADVRKAFDSYYLADVSIGITKRSAELLRQFRDVAVARYRAGLSTQQDVLRAEVELYGLTNRLITLEQERATATARLNALMNRRIDAPLPPPQPLELDTVGWKLDQAAERAVQDNPRLAALRSQIQQNLEAVELARLQYFPDLTVGYTYTFIAAPSLSSVATGDDAQSVSLGINLPIWWQRLRAGVLEGNAQVLRSVAEYEEARNLILFGLQDTLVRIDTQYRQAVLDEELIVPRAWQAIEVSLPAYQAGRLEFTALIDNWRRWLDFSLDYHRSLAALGQAFADLEQLIGVRIERSGGAGAVPVTDDRSAP